MNEEEEEDAMDVALREEKERQESSSNLEKASSSNASSSSKGVVSSSSSASNDGEDELVNALRPFQNHAVSSRDGKTKRVETWTSLARRDIFICKKSSRTMDSNEGRAWRWGRWG